MNGAPRLLALLIIATWLFATGCTGDEALPLGGGPVPAAVMPAPAPSPVTTAAATAAQLDPEPVVEPETPPASEPVPAAALVAPGPPPPRRLRSTAPPSIGARGAVLIDGDSGAVLYEHDAHTPYPPASTTKIMTALLALELGHLDEVVEVRLDDRTYWGSVMGLQNGDRFTLRDLLYGLMLPSGNDAAYAIAVHLAGSESAFAEVMTRRARALGLTETIFRNASGLGRENANVVSAHDLAQIARAAMRLPEFAAVVATRYHTARGTRSIGMVNGNGLLGALAGADGVKIGWGGRFGGQTIVGSATRGGHRLFVALLDTPDRTAESAALLSWAFGVYGWEEP